LDQQIDHNRPIDRAPISAAVAVPLASSMSVTTTSPPSCRKRAAMAD
jgi:hypothetical protein